MTKVVERIAETAIYEYDDYGDDQDDVEEGNYNASEEEEEEEEEDLMTIEQIETKYEKYRDDQMNTGVIAALVGGFALTNSWEMNIDVTDTENLSNVELGSYTLAILAVHGCTCSALVSAFLYRSITRVKSPKASVAWVERHPILVQLPWYKVCTSTAVYIRSLSCISILLLLLLLYCSFFVCHPSRFSSHQLYYIRSLLLRPLSFFALYIVLAL
jgi:hypothetical protein